MAQASTSFGSIADLILYVPTYMTPTATRQIQFEQAILAATRPINGQLPRPWMTDLADPLCADVFIVGRNPARTYDASLLGHERHVDALFNRNGQSCRRLYNELSEPSPTRRNIDLLRGLLHKAGVDQVLETNVICYSSPMSSDLTEPEHTGGRDAGLAVFRLLLQSVRPRVLIAHGAGTVSDLAKVVGTALPAPRKRPGTPPSGSVDGMTIITLPSLAPPAWNGWQNWAGSHLEETAALAAAALR